MTETNWTNSFNNKHIVILGGTGTLGHAIVHKLLVDKIPVSRITIYSRSELNQLEMMEDFSEEHHPIRYILGDVRDEGRLIEVLRDADFVIHAAAMKHVVMCEKNPEECRKTNVMGTKQVIAACHKSGIEKALFISTDKAENPIGVYGESKKEAEQLWFQANQKAQGQFGVVRLGNIVGSRGSVWEIFEKQKKTGVLKVTHQDATRFCISKNDAVEFVLYSLVHLKTDKFSYPSMSTFKIIDLAKSVCAECKIEISGLRPGDKLHEELNEISSSSALVSPNYFTRST